MTAVRTRESRVVVGTEAPGTLLELLRNLGCETALASGGVFVDGKRTTSDQTLKQGQIVTVRRARDALEASPVILQRRAGLLAVEKPAPMPTEPDGAGLWSLRTELQTELRTELHALSRLDVGVSGVVVFTESPAAARFTSSETARGSHRREYLAIACGRFPGPVVWDSAIGGKSALTRAVVLAETSQAQLLLLSPETGRTHQLRIHAARASAPLLGDRRHGGPTTVKSPSGKVVEVSRIALHCRLVTLLAPDGRPFRAHSPAPQIFESWWRDLGGQEADFARWQSEDAPPAPEAC